MDNFNLLCQTIRFQRTALQNSLAMISAVQEHGQKLLKSTFGQSPWLPGEGTDAWLLWTKIWTKNFTGITDLVDKNLATMERLTSTEGAATRKEPTPKPPAPQAEQRTAEHPVAASKEMPPAETPQEQPQPPEAKPPGQAVQTALVAVEPQEATASEEPPGKKSELRPGRQKKQAEPKAEG